MEFLTIKYRILFSILLFETSQNSERLYESNFLEKTGLYSNLDSIKFGICLIGLYLSLDYIQVHASI